MTLTDYAQGLDANKIVQVVNAGKHLEAELLTTTAGFYATHLLYKAMRKVLAQLDERFENTMAMYTKAVKIGDSGLDFLIQVKFLEKAYRFFSEELDILTYMLREYDAYLRAGHILSAFVYGEPRAEEDLHDFLKGNRP